jgi:hypothetical protein
MFTLSSAAIAPSLGLRGLDSHAPVASTSSFPRDYAGERLIAFKFRLHLIGDLQQPFHSADAGDARGNRMRIVAWIPARQSASLLGHRKGRAIECLARSG